MHRWPDHMLISLVRFCLAIIQVARGQQSPRYYASEVISTYTLVHSFLGSPPQSSSPTCAFPGKLTANFQIVRHGQPYSCVLVYTVAALSGRRIAA